MYSIEIIYSPNNSYSKLLVIYNNDYYYSEDKPYRELNHLSIRLR